MNYVNFPVNGAYGWGVCGKSVAREMAKLAPTRLLCDPFNSDNIGNEMEDYTLRRLVPGTANMRIPPMGGAFMAPAKVDGPLLQGANKQLQPMIGNLRGTTTLGYTFFEDTDFPASYAENAKHFDRMAAGSNWCGEIVRRHGVKDVVTVLQGIDPEVFFPHEPSRRFLHDHFVVFSGGKFEFRKGQDIAIRAFKVLQDRHRDVMLLTAWFNPWSFSQQTMRESKHIRFNPNTSPDPVRGTAEVLAANGIDLQRVVPLGLREHLRMADTYRNSDVGLFPSRAEGGTNLVLMEYMACGKPAIATATTGHADVISSDNALIIGTQGEVKTSSDGVATALWPEPVLEEAIEKLEWAYQNRDALRAIGLRGAETMAKLTWERTAKEFLALM